MRATSRPCAGVGWELVCRHAICDCRPSMHRFDIGGRAGSAQTAPWTAGLRGSWIQTGPASQGDVVLAGKDGASQIVVGDKETAAVHQAADFLASDIEKISGYRPTVVRAPGGDRVSIRLVTLGNAEIPAVVGAASMQGQWESLDLQQDLLLWCANSV